VEPELSWSQCDGFDCVVVVAVVLAFDFEPPPPLAAIATPAPPSARAVTAVASRAACVGRNMEASFLSGVDSSIEHAAPKSRSRAA
jgi:hypothetical protein